jgi:transcriptional regulator with GAF, ATPase, and Fis domain
MHTRARERWGDASPVMMIGRHPAFTTALDRLARFAESDSPALITGETGTGKELFARALYLLSRRDGRPFVRVNSAQYHDGQLMASELFGHRRGAFTGAESDHRGLFEAAHHGTLFLDEVADLSAPAQSMLLRTISEGEIVPVGETRARHVDVRLVAATSRDLGDMARKRLFRADLYYRLRGLHLQIPPLRERGDDWELIRDYYLGRLVSARARSKRFSSDAIAVLRRYEWPGNVRELKELVDTGYHLSDGEWIEPRHFIEALEEVARMGQLEKMPLLSIEDERYERVTSGQEGFWSAIHRPYLERDLNRSQVRAVIARGLQAVHGSYKDLLPHFGMAADDYARFMDFLRHHRLKPRRRSPGPPAPPE